MLKEKQNLDNNKKIMYLDILKIFACFMVIVNHVNWHIMEVEHAIDNNAFYCLAYALCKVAVGIFLMITGALVLDKNYNYKKIGKCLLRVFVPVILLSIIYYIIDVGIGNINIIWFFKTILGNPYSFYPYWYAYVLLGVYLAVPFVQKMIKSFTNKDYIVFIAAFLIFPAVINLFKTLFDFQFSSNWQLAFFPPFIGAIVCGNYLSKVKKTKKMLIISCIVFLVSFIGLFLSMYLPSLNDGKISYALDFWDSLPAILMGMSLFYIGRYLFETKNYSKIAINIITALSSTVFGVYLIHTYVYVKILYLPITQRVFKFNIFGTIIFDFIIFIVSMVVIYVIKKIYKIIASKITSK